MGHVDALPLALVHNDLGLEHLLVGPGPQELAGIIDFEDATIGDPAIDLVPFVAAFGRDALVELLDGRDLGRASTSGCTSTGGWAASTPSSTA